MRTTRRGLLAAAAATVVPAKRKRKCRMGWNDRIFPLLIVTPSGGFTGAFFYSPAPGFGNLIESITSAAGTDPYGNAYLKGETSYGTFAGGFQATNTNGGFVTFYSAPTEAGPWMARSEITGFQPVVPQNSTVLSVANTGITANAATFSVANGGSVREWYAPSGGDDSAAIATGLGFGSVDLLPATYLLANGPLPASAATLQGTDFTTIIEPTGGYTGALVAVGAKGSVRNLTLQGGSTDAIQISQAVAEWWLEDLNFASNGGFCINAPLITGPNHGRIRGIRGQGGGAANGGGIRISGGTAGAVTAEINITDIDIQNCQNSAVLHLLSVTDVLSSILNGSVKSAATVPAVHIEGSCQTCWLKGFDVGGGAGVLVIEQGTGNSAPSEIDIEGSTFQSSASGAGVTVHDGSARIRFRGVMSKRSQTDGWLWDGTGGFNTMQGCAENLNNQAAGTNYGVRVSSTAHLLNQGCAYVSGGVTAGRFLAVGNNYTESNPSGSLTTAGAAPGGW